VRRRTALILHGVNVWNTGDLGLLEITVARLREELGPDVRLWSEEVFSHDASDVSGHLDRLGLTAVPALIPLRQHRGWSRPRWLAHVALAAVAVVAVRVFGWGVLKLQPQPIAVPLRAMRDADVVVSKPGGFLYSTADRRIGSPTYLITIWASCMLGRPTVIYGQSVGPFASRLAGAVARRALRGVALATAREPRSHAWLSTALADPTRLHLTADEGFQLQPGPEPPKRPPELGITAIAWRFPGQPDPRAAAAVYETAVADVARWYVDECGGRVSIVRWIIGGHREDDREVVDRLIAEIGRPGKVEAIGPFAPTDASRRLGQMEMLVASRLHSAIFAMVAGTPAVAIEYLPKTGEIMAMAAGEGWVVPIEQVGGGRLLEVAQALYRDLPAVRTTLSRTIPHLRGEAASNARLVAQLLEATP
jgi:colanic acid/amylovoran biosynthesis protein